MGSSASKALEGDVLDPTLEICDAHHHLWNFPGNTYAPSDLAADVASGHMVTSSIIVEAGGHYDEEMPTELKPIGETRFGRTSGEQFEATKPGLSLCSGIVGFADLTLGDRVTSILEHHRAAGGQRLRGIRQLAAWDASPSPEIFKSPFGPSLYSRPDFRTGFHNLEAAGLSFDAWVYHPQLPELTDLARAHPNQPIVLDHLGTPLGVGPYRGRRDEIFKSWQGDLRDLADCGNVQIKIGGLGMMFTGLTPVSRPENDLRELSEAWRPYVETALEIFGLDRCMFESNFPVDGVSCNYRDLWNIFKRITANYSLDEKERLYRNNARRFYKLS